MGTSGLSLSANGYISSGTFASDGAVDTTAAPVGNIYDVLYSGSGYSVSVSHTAPLGVNTTSRPFGPSRLRVRQSPATGPVEFVIIGEEMTADVIDVFDVSGRRVAAVPVAGGTGTRTITWDWRTIGNRSGVYLARLRSRANETARFVMLR